MAGNVEIIIKRSFISAKAAELNGIANSVSARKINGRMNNSKGNTFKSVNELIVTLNSIGETIGNLMSTNAKLVSKMGLDFEKMDVQLATSVMGTFKRDV